jgi:diguanylate cyclase (GGDEF)-like protein/PAS domain S-box-containing protein
MRSLMDGLVVVLVVLAAAVCLAGVLVPVSDAASEVLVLLASSATLAALVLLVRERRRAGAGRALHWSEARYRTLLEQMPDTSVLLFDADLRFVSLTGPALGLLGWRTDEIVGRRLPELLPPELLGPFEERFGATLRGERQTFVQPARRGNAVLEIDLSPLRDDGGRIIGGFTVVRDVTARHRLEQDAAAQSATLVSVAKATRTLSRAHATEVRQVLCAAARELAGADTVTLWHVAEDGDLVDPLTLGADAPDFALSTAEDGDGARIAQRTGLPLFVADAAQDGRMDARLVASLRAGSAYFVPVCDDDEVKAVLALTWSDPQAELRHPLGRLLGLVADEAAVALERAELVGALERQATTDPLTGLPNRRALSDRLTTLLGRGSRRRRLSVAILDLDRFKAYNDTHGHQAGDRLLREAAATWQAQLRPTDLLARLGGEEFAILLPDCDVDTAAQIVGRLCSAVGEGQTASAGIVAFDGRESASRLLARADDALYRAKAAGRDRVIVG